MRADPVIKGVHYNMYCRQAWVRESITIRTIQTGLEKSARPRGVLSIDNCDVIRLHNLVSFNLITHIPCAVTMVMVGLLLVSQCVLVSVVAVAARFQAIEEWNLWKQENSKEYSNEKVSNI